MAIARMQLYTRKERSPVAEQSFGMCIHIYHIVFDLCMIRKKERTKLEFSHLVFSTLMIRVSGTYMYVNTKAHSL